MLRSLAVPGWGQLYNGKWFKALLVVAAQGTLISLAVYYDGIADDFPVQSNEREFYLDRRNLMFWLMGATKLLSMLDAYIDAHLYDFDTGPELGLRIGSLQSPHSGPLHTGLVGVSLQARF